MKSLVSLCTFFFNATSTTEIYTLSLHDALPIYERLDAVDRREAAADDDRAVADRVARSVVRLLLVVVEDRKSTRLNSSHVEISYAVFCLKKKKNHTNNRRPYGDRRVIPTSPNSH